MILGKTQNKIHCRSDLLLNSDQDSMQNSIHDHCKTLNGFVIRTRTASPHHALPGLVLVINKTLLLLLYQLGFVGRTTDKNCFIEGGFMEGNEL